MVDTGITDMLMSMAFPFELQISDFWRDLLYEIWLTTINHLPPVCLSNFWELFLNDS